MNSTQPSVRQLNPMPAVHASPGSGKSFFFDTLANQVEEAGAIPVPINFNSGMSYDPALEFDRPNHSIAARVLWSHYVDARATKDFYFPQFFSLLVDTFPEPCLREAVGLISRSRGSPRRQVVLLVDEILKTGDSVQGVLWQLGQLLDYLDSSRFNLVVSTLDTEPLKRVWTESGRPVMSIVLPAPSTPGVFSRAAIKDPVLQVACNDQTFLETVFARLKDGATLSQGPLLRAFSLYALMSLCGGHWRSLQHAMEMWLRISRERASKGMPDFSNLRDSLLDSGANLPGPPSPFLPLLSPSLLSQPVSLTDTINGKTVSQWMVNGCYLASLPVSKLQETKIVPKIIPLQVYGWAFGEVQSLASRFVAVGNPRTAVPIPLWGPLQLRRPHADIASYVRALAEARDPISPTLRIWLRSGLLPRLLFVMLTLHSRMPRFSSRWRPP
eukprot:TRINITY_DN6651_c0_g1_i1.p1 TRINITY_DN6651_c0_g1~~TRINITY_DN6651_c0_g1_i1.p1  ORF type:complete len:442 (+),score=35.00 TRINITY_DN6651_c0_g1_i1:439-1764(+)